MVTEQLQKDRQFYLENYRCIYICDFGFLSQKTKINEKGSCRFCKKSVLEKQSKNNSHTFPQFIGNRYLISNDECSECNKYFSETLENDLAVFMKIFHNIYGNPDLIKIPNYKLNGIELRRDNNNFEIKGVDEFLFTNNGGKMLLKTGKFIPINVYKGVVKMALTLVKKNELQNFEHTLNWLFSKTPYQHNIEGVLPLFVTVIKDNRNFQKISFLLEKTKDMNAPHYIFKIFYSSFAFQIMIPLSKSEIDKSVDLSYFKPIPNDFELQGSNNTETFLFDMNSYEVDDKNIEISVENLE